MDSDSAGQETTNNDSDSASSNDGVSSNESGSSGRGDVILSDTHSQNPSGSYHDFTSSDRSSGASTNSQTGNDSSRYSLGVDVGSGSQSKSSDSRYSLGVDTSLSGGSKFQTDRTESESSSRSNLSRNESWTSKFSLGIETNSTTSSRYSLGLNESLGISSDSTSSRFSLGIFELPSPSFPLKTGEKTSNGNEPVEKSLATPVDSQTNTESRQKPSSKATNSQQLQPSEESWLRESLDWLKSKANSATKELENWVDKIEKYVSSKSTGSLPSSKQVITSPEKLSQSADQSKVYDSANKLAEDYRNRKIKYTLGAKAWDEDSKESDCSAFVQDAFNKAGKPISINRLTTDIIKNTPSLFERVPEGKQRAGDIILEANYSKVEKRYKGHVGIYSGKQDVRGRPLGVQMGGGGAREAPWGPKGWFAKEYGGNTEYYRMRE